ncbi:MAG: type I methionyl aminopeptidase [Alphaproteobacteria bacterium]|nr:type I methionyl aminopeptidase [Alphaproteobacteria bacterium]
MVPIHTASDYEGMRRAGGLAAQVLDFIAPKVQPGVTTGTLDRLCHDYIVDHHAIPAPLNYKGFPRSICTSINHVVCHGIPDDQRVLKDGDAINIDVTVILDGWHGDTSRMFAVGTRLSRLQRRLIASTYEAMMAGINTVKPGATLGDVGNAIQTVAEAARFSIVRDFCGHGLGRVFHDEPQVLHYGRPGTGLVLKPGMFFTIEPMVNAGKPAVFILADGWTAVTRDKKPSAQFEHSLAVTEEGYEIFTLSPSGLHNPVVESGAEPAVYPVV